MDEAAMWLARLDSGSADPADFEAWRSEDPRRAAAFAQIAGAARTLDRAKPALRYAARVKSPPDRRHFLVAAGAVAALAASGGIAALVITGGKAVASTPVGGRKTIALSAGGSLQLNTDSKVLWKVSEREVSVWLRKGEIALDIRGAGQTCVLYGGNNVATFGAGRVNARLRDDLLDLTVITGQCSVAAAASGETGPGPEARLVATVIANQAILAGRGQQALRPVSADDMQFISAWPEGELVFRGQTLGAAVGEYNRYLDHKIVVADPSLDSVRLGGRFTSHDPAAFLDALHAGLGIRVSRAQDGTAVLTR